jgi:peroxiredoxin
MAEVLSTFNLNPGNAAPDFTLPDACGNPITRDQAAGPNGLLVVFACNHCPFVVHLASALGSFAKLIRSQGVGTVAIVSNDLEKYPQDGPAAIPTFASQHGWDFPYLIDADQSVALAYGAACTPDFFLFDADRRLAYRGRLDESSPKNGKPLTGNDLHAALEAVAPLIRDAVLEEAAMVAEGDFVEGADGEYMVSNANVWDTGTSYDDGRADAAKEIRDLKTKETSNDA